MRTLLLRASLVVVLALTVAASARSAVTYLGAGSLPSTASDLSGLADTLSDGTPHNRLGAFGSAITYMGYGNRYLATPDRGPGGGTVDYRDRFHVIDLEISPSGSGYTITPSLVSTTLLQLPSGNYFTGLASEFDATNSAAGTRRFDPEGVVLDRSGNSFWVSDEYGPFVRQFRLSDGQLIRTLSVPSKFLISNPNANGTLELPPGNTSGRQTNRGMEGLAISPDGTTLFGIMQNALIQDGALNASNSRVGLNNRICVFDIATGNTKEYVYPIASSSLGVNELLAVNDHQFIVIERDGRGLGAGNSATVKNLYLADISGATDVSAIASLPTSGLPAGVTAASKTLFINLLTATGIPAASFPEKIEGLAFGPDLADGRHTLIVTNDNDFFYGQAGGPNVADFFYVFAFDASDLPGFQRQQFDLQPTPTMVQIFRALDTPDGVRIDWRVDEGTVRQVSVERASSTMEEWIRLTGPVTRTGLDESLVDPTAERGTTQYYRLSLALRNGKTFTTPVMPVNVGRMWLGYSLSPMSPNPSRGGGVLTLAIPKTSHVRLSLVDVQGRTVSVLSDGTREAGRYTEAIDASDVSAGLYFVRMQAPGVDLKQRITIMK